MPNFEDCPIQTLIFPTRPAAMVLLSIIFLFASKILPCGALPDNVHHDKNIIKPGNSLIVPGISVSGAIISSDHGDRVAISSDTKNSSQVVEFDVISGRIRNAQLLAKDLPFELTKWHGVFTQPSPIVPKVLKSERGVGLAHYRIWREFIYFDNELIYRYNQTKLPHSSEVVSKQQNVATPSITNDTKLASHDGNYVIYPHNNSFYKYGELFSERDILVVFEDDAESCIQDTNTTVIEELSQMNVDLLFLGWCDGRWAKPVPLCAHAYAITRAGARKMVNTYEPSGKGIDEQFVNMARNNWITWRTAYRHSYKNLNSNYLPVRKDKKEATAGIFRQNKKALGSINGH